MRTKHLFATLVVAVVAAASLGVAVALNAPEVAGRTTASTGGDAGPGTGARASGDPAGRNGGRPAGTASGQTAAEGTGGTGHHDQQRQLSQADLVAKIKPSVVHLAGLSGSGSGVVVDGDRGLVLTNAHVTAGQQGMRAGSATTRPARPPSGSSRPRPATTWPWSSWSAGRRTCGRSGLATRPGSGRATM